MKKLIAVLFSLTLSIPALAENPTPTYTPADRARGTFTALGLIQLGLAAGAFVRAERLGDRQRRLNPSPESSGFANDKEQLMTAGLLLTFTGTVTLFSSAHYISTHYDAAGNRMSVAYQRKF